MGTDVVPDVDNGLEALDGYGDYVAWRHVLNPKLRGNLMYSPFSKLDIGAELGFGQRFLEDDRQGDPSRLHTTVKYRF